MKGIDFETVDAMLGYMKDNIELTYSGMIAVVHNDPNPEANGRYRLIDTKFETNNHAWVWIKDRLSSDSNENEDTSMKINKAAMVKTISKFEELKKEMESDRYNPNNACGISETTWTVCTLKSTMKKLLDLLDEMVRE